jgi:hypothetical protein
VDSSSTFVGVNNQALFNFDPRVGKAV